MPELAGRDGAKMRSMPGLICEIRHFVVPQGVAASCSGVFQALTGELAGYLRFKGVIFGRRNIYLHFKGLRHRGIRGI